MKTTEVGRAGNAGGARRRITRAWFAVAALAWMLVALYALLDAAGLRAHVGVLSGTMPASEAALVGGLGYVLTWFGAVVAAPILLVASVFGLVAGGLARRRA